MPEQTLHVHKALQWHEERLEVFTIPLETARHEMRILGRLLQLFEASGLAIWQSRPVRALLHQMCASIAWRLYPGFLRTADS